MNISFFNSTATNSSQKAANSPSNTALSSSDKSVEQQFLDYGKMSPIDRMRANILKSMNLNEDQLKTMSADERQKVEDLIKEKLSDMLKKSQDTAGTNASSSNKALANGPTPSLSPDMIAQMLSIQAGQSGATNTDPSKGLLPPAQSREDALDRR